MRQISAGYGRCSGKPPLPRTGEGWGEGGPRQRDQGALRRGEMLSHPNLSRARERGLVCRDDVPQEPDGHPPLRDLRIASSRNVLQSDSLTHQKMFSVSVSGRRGLGDVQGPVSGTGGDQQIAPRYAGHRGVASPVISLMRSIRATGWSQWGQAPPGPPGGRTPGTPDSAARQAGGSHRAGTRRRSQAGGCARQRRQWSRVTPSPGRLPAVKLRLEVGSPAGNGEVIEETMG